MAQAKTGTLKQTVLNINKFFVELWRALVALWLLTLILASFMTAYLFWQDHRPTTIVLAAIMMLNSGVVFYQKLYTKD